MHDQHDPLIRTSPPAAHRGLFAATSKERISMAADNVIRVHTPNRKTEPERGTFARNLAKAIVETALFAVMAWALSIASDAAHDLWPAFPAFGYWHSFSLLLGVSAVAWVASQTGKSARR